MNAIFHTDQIWSIENFLSRSECNDLITLSENIGFKEAEVSLPSGAKMIKSLRNNERVLHSDIGLASMLWTRLEDFCPKDLDNSFPLGLNEQFRFYKYELDQRFKRHIDGRFRRNETEESRITFMIYLNEEYEGGETAFDEVTIFPRTGMALCFIHELKHEGCPVKKGVKYALRSDVMYKLMAS
ncbi:hypothetical protein MYP_1417 [Sporocytophaga myxococcoides]|uniref:Fe2OG dioxygenase domain-containing protein n=1 Tax=Sporocytophaga myxococcoides TaxID=153721 RepID=A0A098LCJ5_9BACT|nr:2OG-Fe(II) oxygenase [Sporocytophaga myxococcoides]GAL84189.1 hypothetical protein MYP_1417 [Sporocytophaga myxococcoides]